MQSYDKLSKLVKLVLHIFFGYLISGIYRIIKGIITGDMVVLIVGILALLTGVGNFVFWIIDIITIVTDNKISVLA